MFWHLEFHEQDTGLFTDLARGDGVTALHVKAVFEKLGVSSRGELVAHLFAEHYSDGLHSRMAHIG